MFSPNNQNGFKKGTKSNQNQLAIKKKEERIEELKKIQFIQQKSKQLRSNYIKRIETEKEKRMKELEILKNSNTKHLESEVESSLDDFIFSNLFGFFKVW